MYQSRNPFLFLVLLCILLCALIACGESDTASTTIGSAATQTTAEAATTVKPTPQFVHYPPKTLADLHGLAAKGTVSALYPFDSESVGLTGACPQPKREVTAKPSVTGQRLAEDLLAYFSTQQLNNPCGAVVFAYHTQSEAGDAFTAGRVDLTVTDASGQVSTDPNANGLKYQLTLDVGVDGVGQEYTVAY